MINSYTLCVLLGSLRDPTHKTGEELGPGNEDIVLYTVYVQAVCDDYK